MELNLFIKIIKNLATASNYSTVFKVTESHITYTNGFLVLHFINITGLAPGIYSVKKLELSPIKYPNCELFLSQTGKNSAALGMMLELAKIIKPNSKKPVVIDFLGKVSRMGEAESPGLSLDYLNIAAKLNLTETKLGRDGVCIFEKNGIKLVLCTTV